MASRTPSRRRAGGRSSSRSRPQQNNQMPMIIGGAGLLVLVLILVMANSGGGGDDDNDSGSNTPTKQPASQPEKPRSDVPVAGGSAGKTPDRPAPELSQTTLAKMRDLLTEATAISNAGMKLRVAGENMPARKKQSEAKVLVDQIKDLIEGPSGWYEEADMGGWAIPGEYVTMNRLYAKLSKLEKQIRMQGGK